jgi:tRNA (adenine57-N1/adenine58-N1)-methyltransferase
LDVNPPLPSEDEIPLEILEIGTGQGSLTLHIARAIHAFNGPERKGDNRRAILHTTDIVPKHAEHAEQVVKGFRQGLYANNVDFHTGTPDQFFQRIRDKRIGSKSSSSMAKSYPDSVLAASSAAESSTNPSPSSPEITSPTAEYIPVQSTLSPFLSHIIIDTPHSHAHIEQASKYLIPDGKIIIFNPSITQIGDCTETIKRLNLPLVPETVLELGQGISGGRVWDVRAVLPRHVEREAEKARKKEVVEIVRQEESDALSDLEAVEEEAIKKAVDEQNFVMVCRPKVGRMIVGGGFVGVWRKGAD